MKILNQLLSASGFDTFTCLSYGFELAWFESLLLRQLQYRGVRRFMVLVDQTRLSLDLESSTSVGGGMGRTYLLHGAPSQGTFHPKLYLLSGSRSARLYVGSGNMSRGGLDRNLEVFERWDADDESAPPIAFNQARKYLESLVEPLASVDGIEREHLDHAFRFAARAPRESLEATVLASPPSLLPQIPIGPKPCERLQMVAPFFDEGGEAVRRLVEVLEPRSFEVLVDLRMTNITRRAVETIEALGGTVSKIDADEALTKGRPVHGKLLHARAPGWQLGVVGSANLSMAAWHGRNHELVVVRTGEAASAVEALIDELPRCPLVPDDLERLDALERERQEPEDGADPPPSGLAIRWAKWSRSREILLGLAHDPDDEPCIGYRGPGGVDGRVASSRNAHGWTIEVPPTIHRGSACLVRVAGPPPGPWCVVQDPAELRAFARGPGPEREQLDALLDASDFDPEGAIRLMELIASIQHRRAQEQQHEGRTSKAESSEGGDRPDIRVVSLEDFEHQARPEHAPSLHEGLVPLPSVRLMNRLLFGDEWADGRDDQEAEAELFEEQDEPDEGLVLDHGQRLEQRQRDKVVSGARMIAFLDACGAARRSYSATLASQRLDPYHLLDHLQLLAAPLHYMVRGWALGDTGFRRELVPLLRAFIGSGHAPLITAIAKMDARARGDLWGQTQAFPLLMLLTYNASLADAHATLTTVDPQRRVTVEFDNCHPVLWLRHVVRLMTDDERTEILTGIPALGPRLRTGIFWLAEQWSQPAAGAPFEEFVRCCVAEALALDRLESQLRALGPYRGREPEDEQLVVSLGTPGSMGAGWAEQVGKRERALVHRGAFDMPEAPTSSHMGKMSSVPFRDVMTLDALVDVAESSSLDWLGLDVLDRIARH